MTVASDAVNKQMKPGVFLWVWGIAGWLLIIVTVGFAVYLSSYLTPDSAFYAWRYDLNVRDIHLDKQPTDCEWFHAPLGDKDCHYSKHGYPIQNNDGRITSVHVGWDKIQD